MQQPNAFAKSFLFTTFEAGGVIAPVLAAACKLLARGHRVRVMSDEANRREIEAAGVGFVPWTRAPSRTDRSRDTELFHDWAAATPVDGILQVIHNIMCGPALQYAEDLIEELRREPADLVVGSDFLPGVFAACEAIGQNIVLLTSQLSIHPLAGVPRSDPVSSRRAPMRSALCTTKCAPPERRCTTRAFRPSTPREPRSVSTRSPI